MSPQSQDGRDRYEVAPEQRYRNALVWVRHVAGLHYFGGAFDPEHMRDLANMAAAALQGKDFPDYAKTMADAGEKAAEWAALFATMADELDEGDDDEPAAGPSAPAGSASPDPEGSGQAPRG